MSINKHDLRALITDVLKALNLYSKASVELLMLTAAQESHCGSYLTQVNGTALGIFQMEPRTYKDTWDNYLRYKPGLRDKILNLIATHDYHEGSDLNMRGNLLLQIAMARVYYRRFSERLPEHSDLDGLARYYKKYWNTELGKATVEDAKNNYERFAV